MMERDWFMEYRPLGNSGLMVSAVGLGTNNFGMKLDPAQCRDVTHAALDEGITFFDTADSYGASEERLGEILGARRDGVVIATKFGSDVRPRGLDNGADWGARASRRYVRKAVEASLRRLRTEWIDLYQLHRPDNVTPIEETLSVLTDLVHEGKIRYIGHSHMSAFRTADAEWTSRFHGLEHFVSTQNEYSLLHRRHVERDLLPALQKYGIALIPFRPLANGLLTGKYRRGKKAPEGSRLNAWGKEEEMTNAAFDIVDALTTYAEERGRSLLDVAIGGLAAQPMVASVIAGATSTEQVKLNVAAGSWRPSADDLAALGAIPSL